MPSLTGKEGSGREGVLDRHGKEGSRLGTGIREDAHSLSGGMELETQEPSSILT